MKCFHPERSCMKRTTDHMDFLFEKNKITLPVDARKNDYGEKTEYHDERCHALKASFSITHDFLINSVDSNHMVASIE